MKEVTGLSQVMTTPESLTPYRGIGFIFNNSQFEFNRFNGFPANRWMDPENVEPKIIPGPRGRFQQISVRSIGSAVSVVN